MFEVNHELGDEIVTTKTKLHLVTRIVIFLIILIGTIYDWKFFLVIASFLWLFQDEVEVVEAYLIDVYDDVKDELRDV